MRQILLAFLILLAIGSSAFAQGGLKYETTVAQCNEQWIVCPKGSDDSYQFGFVFTDRGGLTFKLEGAFTIEQDGSFKLVPPKKVNRRANLKGSNDLVSLVPNGKYWELKIGVFPSWYDISNNRGEKVFVLYTEGYVANARGNYSEALIPLNKAYLINPDYKNVRYQFALALNAKGLYEKAEKILIEATKTQPKSFLIYQELSFAQMQLGKNVAAEEAAKKGIKYCKVNEPRCKMALRMAVHYFNEKNKKPFKNWIKQARKYAVDGGVEIVQIKDMLTISDSW